MGKHPPPEIERITSVSLAALIAIGIGSSAQAELLMVPAFADSISWTSGIGEDQFASIKPIAGAEFIAVDYAMNNDGVDVMKTYTSNGVANTWDNALKDNSIWNATVINYK